MQVSDVLEARDRGDVAALVDLLADTDYRVRWTAVSALGRVADPAAIPALTRTLQATDDGLRILAIKSLVRIGETSIVPALVEIAERDPASGVRVTAVDALAKLGDPRGIDMLVGLVLDPAAPIIATSERRQRPTEATQTLARIGSTKAQEIIHVCRWALKRLRELHATDALARLEAAPRPRSLKTRLAYWRTVASLRRV